MKADEGSATDRNARRCSRHHVVIARAVVALVVTDRAHDRELVGDRGQTRKVLREVHARDVENYSGSQDKSGVCARDARERTS